ncbi:MAG: zinc ribbon domain-containing protein [Acidobacteriota bacterium]
MNSQIIIEEKLIHVLEKPIDITKSLQEAFGPMEDWMFEVGPCRFFLQPMTKEWMYYVSFSDQWKETGIKAGEAVFAYLDGDLVIRQTSASQQMQNAQPVFRAGDGGLWKVRASDKVWLKYDGANWNEGVPPFATGPQEPTSDANAVSAPVTNTPQPSDTSTQESICPNCQTPIKAGLKFCGKCGTKAPEPEPPKPPVEESLKCEKCSAVLKPGAKFCPNCGAGIVSKPAAPAFCKNCGNKLAPGAKFCPKCGASAG